MRTKTEIRNVRLYLFWSLLKIPRIFSITGNCKQKIWLKQLKAAPALDFSYFQHASKLVTHHRSSVHNQPESWMWTLDFFAYICVSLISGYSTSLAHDPVAPAFSRNPQQPQLHIFAAIAENRHTADEEGQAHPPSPVTKLNSWRMYIDESNWDRAAHR